MQNNTTHLVQVSVECAGKKHDVSLIKFRPYENIDWLRHGFSTRLGGVSEGIYSSMNLSFSRGDDEKLVMENHAIMAKALETELKDMVYSYQTHTTNVLKVTKEHAGMGFVKERNFGEIDGFVTNEPGITLVTSYADCVPLYFVDIVRRAIGLSHSGWRGTVGDMTGVTVKRMSEEYGTNPKDIIAFIGPSICKSCYEVGSDVAGAFMDRYDSAGLSDVRLIDKRPPVLTVKGKNDQGEIKYHLDLHEANRRNMLLAGIPNDNIFETDVCTCCNPDLLFSHRASKGKRGALCGYLGIKENS